MNPLRIMFMGTPEFAEKHLSALCASGYDVVAAVTQPDKPKGRKMIMTPPPVKVRALELGIPVIQPEKLRDGTFEETLKNYDPNVIVVVAYGKILPSYILQYPEFGCINIHGSLLPKYRGAAPMQRAVINGDKISGVCSMFMDEGMDTGDILLKSSCEIEENDDFEAVHDKLADLGVKTLLLTLEKLQKNELVRIPQNDAQATVAPKILNEDCIIDFEKSVSEVHNRIRGLSPFPLSAAVLNGKKIKFIRSEKSDEERKDSAAGEVVSLKDGKIHIACADGCIAITAILPEGKGRMSASDFINGRKISIKDRFVKAE